MKLEKRGDAPGEPEVPREEKKTGNSRKREISVIVYTTVRFVVALALILLSYKIQQRANSTISDLTEQHGEVTAQALRNIEELQKQNQELTQELEEARDGLEDAQRELEDAREAAEALQGDLETAREEKKTLNAQISEQELKMEELEKRAEAASTLLALVSAEDQKERSELFSQMARLSQYLDEAGTAIYNSLIDEMNKTKE